MHRGCEQPGVVCSRQAWWDALLAQAQANRDHALANRDVAAALLGAAPGQHHCDGCPTDQLEAWYAASDAKCTLRVAESLVVGVAEVAGRQVEVPDGAGSRGAQPDQERESSPIIIASELCQLQVSTQHAPGGANGAGGVTGVAECAEERVAEKICSAVPSPPRMHCLESPLGSPRCFGSEGCGTTRTAVARTPSPVGEWPALGCEADTMKSGGGSGTFVGVCLAGGVELDILANALPRPPEVVGSDGADLGHTRAGDLPRPPEPASDADGSVDLAVLGSEGVHRGSQGEDFTHACPLARALPLAKAPKKQRRLRKGKAHNDDAHKATVVCTGCAASFDRYWNLFRGWGGPGLDCGEGVSKVGGEGGREGGNECEGVVCVYFDRCT